MINGINLATIQFECFNDGNRLLGLTSIDLPEISFRTVDVSGAGIGGTISWPIKGNFENVELTLHFSNLTVEGVKFLNQNNGFNLTLRQATDAYDAANGERGVTAIKMAIRGHTSKLAPGKVEPASQMETELTLVLDYLKIEINGKEVTEIDLFNYKFSTDGQDILSDVTAALGL